MAALLLGQRSLSGPTCHAGLEVAHGQVMFLREILDLEDRSEIVPAGGAPGKFELLVSLMEGNVNDRRTVVFETSNPRFPKVEVVVNELTRASIFGEKWLFSGWGGFRGLTFKVKGEYNIEMRLGWLELSRL